MGNENSTSSNDSSSGKSDSKSSSKSDSKSSGNSSESESRSVGYCYSNGYHAGKDLEKGNTLSYKSGSGAAAVASQIQCKSFGNEKDWNKGYNDAKIGNSYGKNKK